MIKPNNGGVFAVSRAIFDDPDFANEAFTQREAFMWLVANAAWKEHKTRGTRGVVTLQRGEFCFAIRFLAERWQWSKSRVERFISVLKNRDTIRDTSRDSEQVYFIRKYNDFQVIGLPKRDADRDTKRDKSGTRAGQERDKLGTLEQGNRISSCEDIRQTARGSRLPDGWYPSTEGVKFASDAGFDRAGITSLAAQFRDYWAAVSGSKGVKLNWDATWRNWVRNAHKPRSQAPPKVPHHVANSIAVMKSIEAEFGVSNERTDTNNVIDLDTRDFRSR